MISAIGRAEAVYTPKLGAHHSRKFCAIAAIGQIHAIFASHLLFTNIYVFGCI